MFIDSKKNIKITDLKSSKTCSIKSKILRLSPHRILKFCKVQKKQLYENMKK